MEIKVQQWGNSAAIRLPATALKTIGIGIGNVLEMDLTPEGMTLKPAKQKPRYKLADLLAECDLAAQEPAELAAWNAMQPVGREA